MFTPQPFGKYFLVDRISTGGMAEVFLAKTTSVHQFEKLVAIKRILPSISQEKDFITMFIDEAKISALLNHVNIGQIYELGQVEGDYYIAMEYISGKDLRAIQAHLNRSKRIMPLPLALYVGTQMCQALSYAHGQKNPDGSSKGIVHRDISPPNVIISYDGAVKLIDFGIAKAASRLTQTRAGKLKGKFAYMSPEQVQGLTVDHRSDVFSLGILLYELLTNRRLFAGETHVATLNLIRQAEVAPPSVINPDVPLEIDQIILKALAKDRDERYGWATELQTDIEAYFARHQILYETSNLAAWMHHEFAEAIAGEQQMREQIQHLQTGQPLESAGFYLEEQNATTSTLDSSDEDATLDEDVLTRVVASDSPEADNEKTRVDAQALKNTPPPSSRAETGSRAAAAYSLPKESDDQQEEWFSEAATDMAEKTTVSSSAHPPENVISSIKATPPITPPTATATILESPEPMAAASGTLQSNVNPSPALGFQAHATAQVAIPLPTPSIQIAENYTATASAQLPALIKPKDSPGLVFSRLQITLLLIVFTLLTIGGLGALFFLSRELWSKSEEDYGSIVVTTSPPAPCSVSLGATPKGILAPGSSYTLNHLPSGFHAISVTCLGFQTFTTSVQVQLGQVSFIVAHLKK